MASRQPETFVVSIQQTDTIHCGDRRYTLRPLTYGEAADLDRMRSARSYIGETMFNEVLREALVDALGEEKAARHVAAIDAYEEAEIERTTIAVARPHEQESAEVTAAWRKELNAAQSAMFKAQRGRVLAERAVAGHAAVARARAEMADADAAQRDALIGMCLLAWEGPGLPDWSRERDGKVPAKVLANLPASDIEAILVRVEKLRRPGTSEKKA